MVCLDSVPNELLHCIFLRLCINLFLNLLFFFPFGLLLAFTLNKAKRIHLNTRLILAIIPFILALELFSRVGKIVLFQLIFQHLAIHSEKHQMDSNEFIICFSTINFPTKFDQILRWTVVGPTILSHFLLNSLPLALLAENFCATIFYKHYEKGQRFLWLGISILGNQFISSLLLLAHKFRSSLTNKSSQKQEEEEDALILIDFWAFVHLLALLLILGLLSFNNKLSRQLTGTNPTNHDSTLPYAFSKGFSSPRLVTCRYQIRENRRSLHFCVIFTGLICAFAFFNLIIVIFYRHNFSWKINQNVNGIPQFFVATFKSAEMGQQIPKEIYNFLIFFLPTLCTIFGHESLRLSLLSHLGAHCKMFAARISVKAKKKKPICLAVTNASSSSPNSFQSQSNSSSPDSAIPNQNSRHSNNHFRISDALSMNEMLRNAHFDSLQEYWAKNGPEEAKKKKRGSSTGKERIGTGKCKFRSAPCSTTIMETELNL